MNQMIPIHYDVDKSADKDMDGSYLWQKETWTDGSLACFVLGPQDGYNSIYNTILLIEPPMAAPAFVVGGGGNHIGGM